MTFEELKKEIESYHIIITEEGYMTESLKGTVARRTLATSRGVKKVADWGTNKKDQVIDKIKSGPKDKSKDYKDLSDAAKIEGDTKLSNKYNRKSELSKIKQNVVGTTAKGVETVAKGAGVATATAINAAGSAVGSVIMSPKMGKDIVKYKNDPEELKKKLKENKEKILKIKNGLVTGSIAVSSALVGPVDWAGKAIAALGTIGAQSLKDKGLSDAIVTGFLLPPVIAKKIADLAAKKFTGKEFIEVYKEVSDKVAGTLDKWAKSDVIDDIAKNSNKPALETVIDEVILPFTESVDSCMLNIKEELNNQILLKIYESADEGFITKNEMVYLKSCIEG